MSPRLAAAIALMLVVNLTGSFLIKTMTRFWPDQLGVFALLALGVIVVSVARIGLWLALGKRFQLSYIHPFLSLNYVLAVFLGMAAFAEPFRTSRLIGGMIIALSVMFLSRSPHVREPRQGELP